MIPGKIDPVRHARTHAHTPKNPTEISPSTSYWEWIREKRTVETAIAFQFPILPRNPMKMIPR